MVKLSPFRSIIVTFTIFIVAVLIIIFTQLFSSPKDKPAPQANLLKQKAELEELLTKQPQHRDILFNLAKINQELGNEAQAQELFQQAQSLDPNYSIFQEN